MIGTSMATKSDASDLIIGTSLAAKFDAASQCDSTYTCLSRSGPVIH